MTLAEFLHPLRKASQRDLVLAVMYFLRRYEARDSVTTAEVKAAFVRAKHAAGKKIAHAAVLNQAVPFVEARGNEGRRILWALTATGEARVRDLLDLPAAEPEIENDISALKRIAAALPDDDVRGYIDEALVCLRAGALRAAVVFVWTGAVVTLRADLWAMGVSALDAAIKKGNPRAKTFKKRDDFAYVKDVDLLRVAVDLGVIDKSERMLLGQALDLRNQCGHPAKYRPGPKKVSAFVEDVVGIVW
jgi:hypothetical protein